MTVGIAPSSSPFCFAKLGAAGNETFRFTGLRQFQVVLISSITQKYFIVYSEQPHAVSIVAFHCAFKAFVKVRLNC